MDTHLSPALASVLEQQHPRWWWGHAGVGHARTPLLLPRKKNRGDIQLPITGRGADTRFTNAGCPCTHRPETAHGKEPQRGCSSLIILLFNIASSTSLESHHLPASLQSHTSHHSVAGLLHATPQPAQPEAHPAHC